MLEKCRVELLSIWPYLIIFCDFSAPVGRTWWRSPWMCLWGSTSQIVTSFGKLGRTWLSLTTLFQPQRQQSSLKGISCKKSRVGNSVLRRWKQKRCVKRRWMGMRQKGTALYSPLLFSWILGIWTQLQLNVCHSDRTVKVSNNLFSWKKQDLLLIFFYCLSPH